ncbi:hypothetical protein BKA93DRAFT_152242 [Sparassis latifolia]
MLGVDTSLPFFGADFLSCAYIYRRLQPPELQGEPVNNSPQRCELCSRHSLPRRSLCAGMDMRTHQLTVQKVARKRWRLIEAAHRKILPHGAMPTAFQPPAPRSPMAIRIRRKRDCNTLTEARRGAPIAIALPGLLSVSIFAFPASISPWRLCTGQLRLRRRARSALRIVIAVETRPRAPSADSTPRRIPWTGVDAPAGGTRNHRACASILSRHTSTYSLSGCRRARWRCTETPPVRKRPTRW